VNKYILLDRDGTLIEFRNYLTDPRHITINRPTIKGLQLLSEAGYRFGVITNQSLIGRGIASKEQVELVNSEMLNQFNSYGIRFDFVLYCPHSPLDLCDCRKPKISLGLKAIAEYGINVQGSYMIGDMDSDMEFGNSLNLTTIKISSNFSVVAKFTVGNLFEASKIILSKK
jgi:D-glycero-D-manno-heptose 1,7-bisphosphate phosphatase